MNKQAFSKIWIVVILAVFVVGGILVYQYWRVLKEKVTFLEVGKEIKKPIVEEPEINLTTTKLAIMPEDCIFSSFSPNGRHAACVVKKENKQFVVLDGEEGKKYDGINALPIFSSNSKHLAYVATEENKQFVVLDGEEGKKYDGINALPIFSSNSKHLAYVATEENKQFVVLDGEEGKSYDEIPFFSFSPDGKHLAYTAKKEGKYFVVLDSKEKGPYEDSGGAYFLFFSPDSKHLAYVIWKGLERPTEELRSCLVLDGKEKECYGGGYVIWFLFSPDSKHLAYRAAEVGMREEFVVLDGKKQKNYASCSILIFSPDSSHLLCGTPAGKIILDEKEIGRYGDNIISKCVFSPDSQHFACSAGTYKRDFMIVDGEKEAKIYEEVLHPVFSPDSKHLAYVATEEDKQFVVLDGEEGKKYDNIYTGPKFSKDGEYICYGTRIGNELWWIVDKVE